MNGPIGFFVFSGAGNTLLVAERMSEVFREHGIEVHLAPLERTDPADTDRFVSLGLAFTVAMFSTYPFVWDFMEKLPPGRGREVFMVDTMGGMSGGMVGPLKSLLVRKGYKPVGAREIRMPSNYSRTETGGEKDREKIRKGLGEARKYATELLRGTSRWGRFPVAPDLVSRISRNPMGRPWRMMRKSFVLEVNPHKCTRCGLCKRICPVGNIRIEDIPVFGSECQLCQRCFAFCPEAAISVSGKEYVQYRSVERTKMLKFLGESA
ncbi:MAG: EFR1 family ferrodoxin [Synergistota bacterium]|nr:EFR1 family ferrodoxin [Synergistota bacterium]